MSLAKNAFKQVSHKYLNNSRYVLNNHVHVLDSML